MHPDERQTGSASGARASRAIVRSAYGPWLLLAIAVVALPGVVPASAVGHACRVAAVDGRVGALLAAFDADAGEPTRVGGVRAERAASRVVWVDRGTPLDRIGVCVLAMPPPSAV